MSIKSPSAFPNEIAHLATLSVYSPRRRNVVRPDYTAGRHAELVRNEIKTHHVARRSYAFSRIWPEGTMHEYFGEHQVVVCRWNPELSLVFREMVDQLCPTGKRSQRTSRQIETKSYTIPTNTFQGASAFLATGVV